MKPVIASTWSFGEPANAAAWPILSDKNRGDASLSAVEEACRHADLNPDVDSVGYGGLPDAHGRMSLDGAIMLSPFHFGGVCGLRRHLHPASIGRLVMERTEHGLLCGEDADAFADSHGVPEAEILSTEAHDTWRTWLENRQEKPSDREGALRVRPLDGGPGTGKLFGHDTIGVLAIDEGGVLAAGCSTSGLAFKVPGRVGDSPIVGHGLYVLPGIGAVTATGTGELISGTCVSFVAIEAMRNGATPFEAVASSLDRVDNLEGLESYHQVALVAMDSKGTVASGALRGGFRAAIHDEQGGRVVDPDVVVRPDDQPLPEKARDGISQGEDT